MVGWLVGFYINLCRLFNAKPNFIQIISSIQSSISTQFNCQKYFNFKLFSLGNSSNLYILI